MGDTLVADDRQSRTPHTPTRGAVVRATEPVASPFDELRGPETTTVKGVEYTNKSGLPLAQLLSWLPRTLDAERVVFLPDVCPGKSPLPTGCVVETRQADWRKFAVSDVGCGMQLLESCVGFEEFDKKAWDAVGHSLRQNAGKLGDLGGGNHFLDAMVDLKTWKVYFLVHTGSRLESGIVDALVDSPRDFDRKFAETVDWARANRDAVTNAIEKSFGTTELVLDLPHNTYEKTPSGSVIIRKGAVKAAPGELSVLPSYMAGDVSLVRSTSTVAGTLNSLSHGTGRALPRGKARELIGDAEIETVRRRIYVPDYIANESLRTDAPRCYRDLDTCLGLLGDTVVEEQRFAVIAYLGHL